MNLNEIVDSLIELSCHEMPEEARKSLDDAIDHIVSNMNENQLKDVLGNTILDEVEAKHPKIVWKEEGDEEEIKAIKSLMEGNIAIA